MKHYIGQVTNTEGTDSIIVKTKFSLGQLTNKGIIVDIFYSISLFPSNRLVSQTKYTISDGKGNLISSEEKHLKSLEN